MKPFWLVFVVLVAAAGGGYYWWKHQAGPNAQGPEASAKAEGKAKGRKGRGGPLSVRTITPKRQPMPVLIDAVGTVESQHSVAVHPQVSGVLTAVRFKEGDYVQKGQVLFEIDPRPMQAAVEQSQAAVRRDEAQLAQARAQEERLRSLVDKDYITRQEYDVAATTAKSLEATVNANRAALEQAKLQLAYSRIVAPISGEPAAWGCEPEIWSVWVPAARRWSSSTAPGRYWSPFPYRSAISRMYASIGARAISRSRSPRIVANRPWSRAG